MILKSLTILIIIFLSGCSSRSNLSKKYSLPKKSEIAVRFIPQEDYQCGPASLQMMMLFNQKKVSLSELTSQAFTKNKQGSFQSDMITTVRRQELIPVMIKNLKNLLTEISLGQPVLVLQNLGLDWIPRWHYAVVVGYDLKKDELILHSGKSAYMRMALNTFNRTWNRSNNWGILVIRPGQIPSTASEIEMVRGTAHLENLNFLESAKLGHEAILKRWPESFAARIGLGNVYYNKKDFKNSIRVLKEAVELMPQSSVAWNNYSQALKAGNRIQEATRAAQKASMLNGP